MTIAQRIRQARLDRKLTLTKVAEGFGISRVAVAQWEGKAGSSTLPDVAKLGKLARILGVTCDWLLTGEGQKARTPVFGRSEVREMPAPYEFRPRHAPEVEEILALLADTDHDGHVKALTAVKFALRGHVPAIRNHAG